MRFPTRENDIRVLAELLIDGLVDHPEYFPTPPVTPDDLKASFDSYKVARDTAIKAAGAAKDAFDVKDETLDVLTEHMRANLKYAEFAAGGDEGKLNMLGWGGRRSSKSLETPAQPRFLEVARSGKGWIFLDWKPPLEGGEVAAYKVQVARPEDGVCEDVGRLLRESTVAAWAYGLLYRPEFASWPYAVKSSTLLLGPCGVA